MKTINGITITPIKNLALKKKKEGRHDKVLQGLPKDCAFSVKREQVQNVRNAAMKLKIGISCRKQVNGLYAIIKK